MEMTFLNPLTTSALPFLMTMDKSNSSVSLLNSLKKGNVYKTLHSKLTDQQYQIFSHPQSVLWKISLKNSLTLLQESIEINLHGNTQDFRKRN